MLRSGIMRWSLLLTLTVIACGGTTADHGASGNAGLGGSSASTGPGGSSGSAGSNAAGTGGGTDASSESDVESPSDGAILDLGTSDAAACASDGACSDFECCYQDHCIRNGEPCGEGSVCFFSLPSMGSCQRCGYKGQPCCPMNTCLDGSRCLLTPQGARCLS